LIFIVAIIFCYKF